MYKKVLSGVMGLVVGDALGVPVEFIDRKILKQEPVIGMMGFGTHNQPPGTWSDDSSMTLCLLDSIAACGGLNLDDVMDRFLLWADKGYYTAHHAMFDIGITTRKALLRYTQKIPPVQCGGQSEYDNGNGALMRILPMVFYIYWKYGYDFINREAIGEIEDVCSLTHGHPRSKIACVIYVGLGIGILHFGDLSQGTAIIQSIFKYYEKDLLYAKEWKYFERIWKLHALGKLKEQDIQSSGYVIHTLEAALWCLLTTKSYQECVLKAVNLGEDTDTTGAVCGGLAGLLYGWNAIPLEWTATICRKDLLERICFRFTEKLTEKKQ